jgi:hypothetical protein
MRDYLEHTYNVVNTSLDRHLYILQNKIYTTPDANFNKKDVNNLRDALKYKQSLIINKLESKNEIFRIHQTIIEVFFILT